MSYIDADMAVTLINSELLAHGEPPIFLTDRQRVEAFATLQMYAQQLGRPLDLAIKDVVRFQLQSKKLEELRRQT